MVPVDRSGDRADILISFRNRAIVVLPPRWHHTMFSARAGYVGNRQPVFLRHLDQNTPQWRHPLACFASGLYALDFHGDGSSLGHCGIHSRSEGGLTAGCLAPFSFRCPRAYSDSLNFSPLMRI